MLFLHEVHEVTGKREDDFEAAIRDGWMPALAEGDEARLLYYTTQAHGSGKSYQVVTLTGVSDGAAWERLARRIQSGDLQKWMRELDELRRDVTGKILLPVYWSPLQEVDLATVPTDAREHESSLFMEDTGWPYSSLDEYIQMWDVDYYQVLSKYPSGLINQPRRRHSTSTAATVIPAIIPHQNPIVPSSGLSVEMAPR